ncbi:MAG: endonuclease/exonuclease/phosphatase family protein [Pseudomonadota bacterium]
MAEYISAEPKATVRIATFTAELTRKGPGLLLRDILSEDDPQVVAVQNIIIATDPDVLLLVGFDYDLDLQALRAFANQLESRGAYFPHLFAQRPNSGRPSGLDLDGDGRLGGPRDAHGYGAFSGQGGMALLSRYPFAESEFKDFTTLLWRDLPGAELDDLPFGPDDALRLSSVNHWAMPVTIDGLGNVELLAFGATPPVFDGPEDMNGRRNADELRLWQLYLDGVFGPKPENPVILLGKVNVDPADGEGRPQVLADLMAGPWIQDPQPSSQGGANEQTPGHVGPAELDTSAFADPPDGPGNLRLDYVLPDRKFSVAEAGVYWPVSGDPGAADIERAARHRLVWVDLMRNR